MEKSEKIIWALRIIAAGILLQTLFFKFSGAEESIYIFSTLGIEPYGRIGSGIAELVVAILILIPKTTWIGALGGCGVMAGAILSHLFVLGISVQNDGGLLFLLALITLLCCLGLLYFNKSKLFNLLNLK
ncbi:MULTISPECIES: DoxX family membrane protein [Flavobacterium]|uniref:DoxX family protein n=2 Tax=Flavobacterium TaxID=237 RepID=A0A1S1J576_9FLAO|nr:MULTISPECIES: DoxX family membrane protein [Flavobacterium]MCC9017280.1 DoxX family protein [Flavobacterium sp. F-126]MDL2143197.1 DoxX family protein [Flavobacterium tructae]OHT44751.1 DoxX family protein [Flavobacterium tructae]OXB19108.1 DoxX family protein [Flavobacterium tructae]URC13230.1 DoxX family protein [Flavobacterium sp. B183]